MYARSRKINHPIGRPFETPLLIPSFSSKGFGFSKNGESELPQIVTAAEEFITDSLLVSAYDLHHGHVAMETGVAEITIVDSGGYETSDQIDLSETFVSEVHPKEWNREKLTETLDAWPAHIPAVFVSYDAHDDRMSLDEQVSAARPLIARYPNQLHAFLIKPETRGQKHVQVENIIRAAGSLSPFNVIGLTEKELGSKMIDRMVNLWRIRRAMDEAGATAPIHVFGCLDPASICLYFVAGAEMFDGLAWLRYAFHEGSAIYRNSFAAKTIGLHRTDDFVKMKTMQDNLSYLSNMQVQMRTFLHTQDFSKLEWNGELVRRACAELQERVKH